MATNLQRVTAIADGLVNRTATDAEKDEWGEARYGKTKAEWDLLTNAQKLSFLLANLRQQENGIIKAYKDNRDRDAVNNDPNALPEA